MPEAGDMILPPIDCSNEKEGVHESIDIMPSLLIVTFRN